jgi:hypothetical protein
MNGYHQPIELSGPIRLSGFVRHGVCPGVGRFVNDLRFLLDRERMSVAGLERIYLTLAREPGFLSAALRALRELDESRAYRASWLLGRFARDQALDEMTLKAIAEAAEESSHWIVRLNLCQLFARAGCPASLREKLFPFLDDCMRDPRAIIRAWALSALMPFAADREYRLAVRQHLLRARRDPSKAMQARLRKLKVSRGVGRWHSI